MRGNRLSSLWIVLSLAAPPCQEVNPDFDGAATDAAGTSTTNGPTTTPGDDGVTGTASSSVDGTGSGEADTSTSDPPADTTQGPDPTSVGTESTSEPMTGSSDGSSTGGCVAPMMMCGAECVDTMTDNDHCGECFNDCHPVQEICEMGACVDN